MARMTPPLDPNFWPVFLEIKEVVIMMITF
jgi:hypothetical protein